MVEFSLHCAAAGLFSLPESIVGTPNFPCPTRKSLFHLLDQVVMHKVLMGGYISQVQLKVND